VQPHVPVAFVGLERARQAPLVQALIDVVLRAEVAHLHAEHRRGKEPEPRAVRSADVRAAQRLVVFRGPALQDDAELALRHRSRWKYERCDAEGNEKLLHVVSPQEIMENPRHAPRAVVDTVRMRRKNGLPGPSSREGSW